MRILTSKAISPKALSAAEVLRQFGQCGLCGLLTSISRLRNEFFRKPEMNVIYNEDYTRHCQLTRGKLSFFFFFSAYNIPDVAIYATLKAIGPMPVNAVRKVHRI